MAREKQQAAPVNEEANKEAARTLGEEGLARDSREPLNLDQEDHVEITVALRGTDRDASRQLVENALVGTGALVLGHGDVKRQEK